MSATEPLTLDIAQTRAVPFGRLVGVELRKMADTRAGVWLLSLTVLVTAAFMVIFFFVADADERIFANFIGIAATPQGFVLPVLGILLITSEWGQRTAMVTFALEPSRSRVIGSKVVAALILGLGAFVAAIALASLGTLIGGADGGFEDLKLTTFLLFLGLQILTVLQGLAYGLIFLNTPAAIVTFFVLPIASSIIFSVVPALQDSAPWVDLGTAQQPLFELGSGGELTSDQLAHLGTTSLIWIILPFLIGLVRVMRAELK
jgi:ABC-2 type transport system permease protein